MDHWIVFSLLAPLFWSFSNYVDQFLTRHAFKDDLFGLFVFVSLWKWPSLIVIFWVFHQSMDLTFTSMAVTALPAAFYVLALIPYFFALNRSDASIAIPIFQTIPFFTYIFGWLFLGEIISLESTLFGLIIILGSMGIVWDYASRRFNWETLGLMLLSCILFSLYFIALRVVTGNDMHFAQVTLHIYGWYFILGALVFLFSKNQRRKFVQTARRKKGQAVWVSLSEDIFDVGGTLCAVAATALAPAAVLVTLVIGVQPFYILLIGVLLGVLWPGAFEKVSFNRHLAHKIIAILVMFAGLAGLLFNQ